MYGLRERGQVTLMFLPLLLLPLPLRTTDATSLKGAGAASSVRRVYFGMLSLSKASSPPSLLPLGPSLLLEKTETKGEQ